MRTLIWNVTASTQTLPEVYGSTEIATRWGYVTSDTLADTIANLGGFSGMNSKWAVLPISPDEELGSKQVFGGGFAVALGADGNVPWGNITGKPTWATVAFSGQYSALVNKPALSAVATSGQYSDLAGRPTVAAASDAAPSSVDSASSTAGTSADVARADHKHAHGNLLGGSLHADATTSSSGFMSAAQVSKLAGIAANAAALGLVDPTDVGYTSSGSSDLAARADHAHAHGNLGGGALHADAAPSYSGFMSAADKSKLDGVSANAAALAVTDPAAVGTVAVLGSATTAAKADHVHAHGNQAGGALHAKASATADGFMSKEHFVKVQNPTYDLAFQDDGPLVAGDLLLEFVTPRALVLKTLVQLGGATAVVQTAPNLTTTPTVVSLPGSVTVPAGTVITVKVTVGGTKCIGTIGATEA